MKTNFSKDVKNVFSLALDLARDECDLQTEEGKGLCPYYSLWTKQNKNFNVNHKWLGLKNHQKILEEFQNNEQ